MKGKGTAALHARPCRSSGMSLSDTMGTDHLDLTSDEAAGLYKMVNVLVLQGSLALHTQGFTSGRKSRLACCRALRLALVRHPCPPVPIQDVTRDREDERCEQAVENVLVGAEPGGEQHAEYAATDAAADEFGGKPPVHQA